MGDTYIQTTKNFLLLFNFIFFVVGAVILGFGVWVLVDRSSFILVLQTSSSLLKVGAYVFISLGAVTMIVGFLGCIGTVNEDPYMLGLYFILQLLILIAQVTSGTIFYYKEGKLTQEMGTMVMDIIRNYNASVNDSTSGNENNLQEAWDHVQTQVRCCGWMSYENWTENQELMNYTEPTFPCSCEEEDDPVIGSKGFCKVIGRPNNTAQTGNNLAEWPVYDKGCKEKVQAWIRKNLSIILGLCVGIAIMEVLGMLLSICLCQRIYSEDYVQVIKY